jgi:DNA-binding MarR family transcriptional regulator
LSDVTGILERRLALTRPMTNLVQRGMVNLQVAYAHFEEDFERTVGREGLSSSSYNALRILRGHPDGHPRGELARRLVYRRADVTRLIDVLVRRGFVERVRSQSDRRLSLAKITPRGVKTLARLDSWLDELIALYEKKLTKREWQELSRLLEGLYASHVD